MPRPRKWRRVCNLPNYNSFGPLDKKDILDDCIIMTVEEYETIRLMDLEGLNQEECAGVMGVARSTVQRIYDDSRKKLADSLVNGKVLKIEGGDYKLCSEYENVENCNGFVCGGRHRHGRNRGF